MDNYKRVLKQALENKQVSVSVQDISVDYFDLENSRKYTEIIEACEATDQPLVCFYVNGIASGNMMVMVGEGDDSISDHHVNDFMDSIMIEF
jgi:hypothetical protein